MRVMRGALILGAATAVIGPATIGAVMVTLGQGTGAGAKAVVVDGVPALRDGFTSYEGGAGGLLGEAPAPPLGAAPGGPGNPG